MLQNLIENWQSYVETAFEVFGAAVAFASVIVKITPSQKDDAFMAKVIKIFDQLSIFNPNGKKVVNDK